MASQMIRMVFLDFDGVIIESAIVKKAAYRKLFEKFPDHQEEIEAYQRARGGLPRRQQFEEIFDRILGRNISISELDDLERNYIQLMLGGVMKAPFVPGAEDFLRDFHDRVDLYLVSATPERELLHIVRERGLGGYFKKIHGSPPAKAEIFRAILRETGYSPGEGIFVGDYPTDREAAEEVGIPFVARLGSVPEMKSSRLKIRDLRELPGLLNGMYSIL